MSLIRMAHLPHLPDLLHLCLCHRPVDPRQPRLRSRDGSGFYPGTTRWFHPTPHTRPPPVICSGGQSRLNRILFHVAQHCQYVIAPLDGKRFEVALPHRPTGLMSLVTPLQIYEKILDLSSPPV